MNSLYFSIICSLDFKSSYSLIPYSKIFDKQRSHTLNMLQDKEEYKPIKTMEPLFSCSSKLSDIYLWSLRYNSTIYNKDLFRFQGNLIQGGNFARDALAATYLEYNDSNRMDSLWDYYNYVKNETLDNGCYISSWKSYITAYRGMWNFLTPKNYYIAIRPLISTASQEWADFTDKYLYDTLLVPLLRHSISSSWFMVYSANLFFAFTGIYADLLVQGFISITDLVIQQNNCPPPDSIKNFCIKKTQDFEDFVFLVALNLANFESQFSDLVGFTIKTNYGYIKYYESEGKTFFAEKNAELREYALRHDFSIYDNHLELIERFGGVLKEERVDLINIELNDYNNNLTGEGFNLYEESGKDVHET